ncbi:MAG: hypothetical protein R2845_12945 [Thermomicrobiales bacterium]
MSSSSLWPMSPGFNGSCVASPSAMRLPGLETGFSESALLDVLADRRLLLVLDNLEQIPRRARSSPGSWTPRRR